MRAIPALKTPYLSQSEERHTFRGLFVVFSQTVVVRNAIEHSITQPTTNKWQTIQKKNI
jgi:hypothetical protein